QLQSPLLRLPAEIKHVIYKYCLIADETIENPIANIDGTKFHAVPALGVALMQTCRRVYLEVDRRPLFNQNTFCFTTADKAKSFFKTLDHDLRMSIADIEVDVRELHSDQPDLARDWLQYLAWDDNAFGHGSGSLQTDAPALRTLRLNFQSWPRIPLFRQELWKFLKYAVSGIRGLDRVVITGASKGLGMARRDPWSAAHFVGADNV
ncbi:hypothetical protein EK21DRAFT_42372, partial [Setomelanomma holmii]